MFLVIFGLIVLAEVGYQVNIHSYLLNLKTKLHVSGHFMMFWGLNLLKNVQNGKNSVIMFLVIFGLIVLAEVGHQVNIKNEQNFSSSDFWVKNF